MTSKPAAAEAHRCPTCGSAVTIVGSDEGTNHYEPVQQRSEPGLDVDRLLEAWVKHMKRNHPDDDYDDPTYECAEHTAAEYARLSPPENAGGGEDG